MKLTRSISARLPDPTAEALRANFEQRITELQSVANDHEARLPGRFLGRRVIEMNGTYTETPGTTAVIVEEVGGGGGGGGAGGGANAACGGGGASGQYRKFSVVASPGGKITGGAVSIGAGGTGGANTGGNGGNGGNTSVVINGVTYAASGGGGGSGTVSLAVAFGFPGGTIGTVPGVSGEVSVQGAGQPGLVVSTALFWGGSGGSTPLGAGGATASGSSNGNAGFGYGGGGGGACTSGATGRSGAAGSIGAVVIEEFS